MRLFEHPDFEQAVIRAAEHLRPRGLWPAIIENACHVTEALRAIPRLVTAGGQERNPSAESAKLLFARSLQRVDRSLLQLGRLD